MRCAVEQCVRIGGGVKCLVVLAAFKAVVGRNKSQVGSIPIRLRHPPAAAGPPARRGDLTEEAADR